MTTEVGIRSLYVICNYNWLELWRVGEKEEVTMTTKAYLGNWMYTKGAESLGWETLISVLNMLHSLRCVGHFQVVILGRHENTSQILRKVSPVAAETVSNLQTCHRTVPCTWTGN